MQVIDSMATQTGLLAASDTSLGRRRAAALLCRLIGKTRAYLSQWVSVAYNPLSRHFSSASKFLRGGGGFC